jgi:hypothetical protein
MKKKAKERILGLFEFERCSRDGSEEDPEAESELVVVRKITS